MAGKTGTAQNSHGEDHAWFVAFAPADDPQIVLAVLAENAGQGGEVAAPIAREILQTYFRVVAPEQEPGVTVAARISHNSPGRANPPQATSSVSPSHDAPVQLISR